VIIEKNHISYLFIYQKIFSLPLKNQRTSMNQSLNNLKKIANIFSPPLCFVLCMFYLCVIIVAKKQKFKLWSKFSHHKN
ncbi:TPA: hypothetical protein QFM60_002502, partial [Enterococcus faecium]